MKTCRNTRLKRIRFDFTVKPNFISAGTCLWEEEFHLFDSVQRILSISKIRDMSLSTCVN